MHWRILQTDAGTFHFVGRESLHYHGRVSSAIARFGLGLLRGTTRSGPVYPLVGPVCFADVADYVWRQWCSRNGGMSFEDVTDEFLRGTRP